VRNGLRHGTCSDVATQADICVTRQVEVRSSSEGTVTFSLIRNRHLGHAPAGISEVGQQHSATSTLRSSSPPTIRRFRYRHKTRVHYPVFDLIGLMPYHPIVAIPRNAAKQLNTSATIPLGVKPAGSVPGLLFSPFRSRKFTVLPAAFPAVGTLPALQALQWSSGILPASCCCMSIGRSIMVAMRPDATCHSM
jgi:hypothetical protein